MKVFFTASVAWQNPSVDINRYSMINDFINSLGHESTNYAHYDAESSYRLNVEKEIGESNLNTYDFTTKLITESDILIADITTQSFKAGYQLDFALHNKIPALVIYKKWENFIPPIMLQDNRFGLLTVKEYISDSDIKLIIKEYLENILSGKIKFNFFINHKIYNYLNRRAKIEGRNKSDIVRDIIMSEIYKNPIE